jgi:hypothetical protein
MSSVVGSSTGGQAPLVSAEMPEAGWKGYCETIVQVAACLRTYTSQTGEDAPDSARSISSRERAHREGECNSPLNGKQPIFALLGYQDIRTLEGRLLTIADATFSDPQQRKAFKDLVRKEIWFNWAKYLDTDDVHVGMPVLNR